MLLGTKIEANVNGMALMIQLPAGLHVVDDAYVDEHDKLAREADTSQWWTIYDVATRYKRQPAWIKDHILFPPRLEKQLHGRCVIYDGDGGGRGYLFEPTAFSKFMREWFPEIAKDIREGTTK